MKRGDAYKIGFSRKGLSRRVRESGGVLVLAIPTGQHPSALEYAINHHFRAKRLPPQGPKAGEQREWFALAESDLDWLRGLERRVTDHKIVWPGKLVKSGADHY